jgi:hypothetical protein
MAEFGLGKAVLNLVETAADGTVVTDAVQSDADTSQEGGFLSGLQEHFFPSAFREGFFQLFESRSIHGERAFQHASDTPSMGIKESQESTWNFRKEGMATTASQDLE